MSTDTHTLYRSLPVFQATAKLFARVSFTTTGSIARRNKNSVIKRDL